MKEYYNIQSKAKIDLINDSCQLDSWDIDYNKNKPCAMHPKGYYVFIKPDELINSDEYNIEDPYSVNENINSEFHQRRFNHTKHLLSKHTKKDRIKILDLGCGEGHLTNAIQEENDAYEVYGLDYSNSAIEYANSNFPGIDFIVADAYFPPYCDSYFDVVICNNIWEHVADPLTLLSGIRRILKKNGLLIITTPSRYRFGNVLRIICGIGTKLVSKLHVTEYSVGQIKEQLKHGNFTIIEACSPTIKEKNMVLSAIKFIFLCLLRIIQSKHILESTVFYVAIKKD